MRKAKGEMNGALSDLTLGTLLMLAAGCGAASIDPFVYTRPNPKLRSVLTAFLGTSVLCTSVGLAFQRFGAGIAITSIAMGVVFFLAWSGTGTPMQQVGAYLSAALLLAYVAATSL